MRRNLKNELEEELGEGTFGRTLENELGGGTWRMNGAMELEEEARRRSSEKQLGERRNLKRNLIK